MGAECRGRRLGGIVRGSAAPRPHRNCRSTLTFRRLRVSFQRGSDISPRPPPFSGSDLVRFILTRMANDRRNLLTLGALLGSLPVVLLTVVAAAGMAFGSSGARAVDGTAPPQLPAVQALPMRMDTLYLGGYASGSFAEALQSIAGDLSVAERTMIGRHLDRMFAGVLRGDMARGGRLRLACERTLRPDGTTRSVRVLAAEAAVGGRLHTAFFFEHAGQPGYFDERGISLDPRSWARPVAEMRVTSHFGLSRLHPILNRVLPHLGTDYAAPAGTPVRATGDGSVSMAEWRGGYGRLIEIQHPNGYATRYAHLSRIAPHVRPGAMVQQGELIGYVGMTGMATGPHLHYEVRRHGRPVNPEQVAIEGGPAMNLAFDVAWRSEQRRLARLLEQAPRLGQARRGG